MNRSVKKIEAREGDKNQCKYMHTLEDLLFSFFTFVLLRLLKFYVRKSFNICLCCLFI